MSRSPSGWRARITDTTVGLFGHAPDPLSNTFDYRGDPGLFGPDSVTWRLMGNASSFAGGIRALLVQAAHPEVAAGVGDHSAYRDDPLGRLSRTASYVTATAYGSMPEVESAIAVVRRAHEPVQGTSHRGMTYSASAPEMAAWVHNALVDSFLTAYCTFGPVPLSDTDADAYVAEQTRLGALMGAEPLPDNVSDLREWLVDHRAVGHSPAGADAIAFLSRAPLRQPTSSAYQMLYAGAVATIPRRLRQALGLRVRPGGRTAGRAVTGLLHAALGFSSAWAAALDRCGAPRPVGIRFRATDGVAR